MSQSQESRGKGSLTWQTGTSQFSSEDELDPDLASFCQRFNLDPQVPDFEDGDEDLDLSDELEIVEQLELDYFCAVLQCAQQVAIEQEREKMKS